MAKIVVFVPDLMDRSKVLEAASGATVVRAVGDLVSAAASADVVVVDLERPGVVELLPALVSTAARVAAFGRHTSVELLAAARESGATVEPRSKAFADLAAFVQGS